MSAQGLSGAEGGEKKSEKASPCERCGNRHQGPCLPQCGFCGKVHKGRCRYATPLPSTQSAPAAREPTQQEMAARYQAQEMGQWMGREMGQRQGYQQAYNEMRSFGMGPGMGPAMGQGMGPGMGPAMGGPFSSDMGGFGGPNRGPYGGFGNQGWGSQGWGAQGWGSQMPPPPPMGQVLTPSGQGASRSAGRPGNGRKPFMGKKGDKGLLAPGSAGVEKSTSRSAKQKARRKLKAQDKVANAASSGPTDPGLLAQMAGEVQTAPANDADMADAAAAAGEAGIAPVVVDAQSMIAQARANPAGFHFPEDLPRVEHLARSLERFGQDRLQQLFDVATRHNSSILYEAWREQLLNAESAATAAQVSLPETGTGEDDL